MGMGILRSRVGRSAKLSADGTRSAQTEIESRSQNIQNWDIIAAAGGVGIPFHQSLASRFVVAENRDVLPSEGVLQQKYRCPYGE